MGLSAAWPSFRRLLAPFSPARRRWVRFLHRLPLDPDRLGPSLSPPSDTDFIMCGSPRSGTTLLCAALFQPPSVLTVMEPWDGMRLEPGALFARIRHQIGTTGMLRPGRLDAEALLREGVTRWCPDGAAELPVELSPHYLLGVKWPAYWRYLELLPSTKFLVCLRHPFEVVASYKKAGGRLAQGLEYDTAFNRSQNETLLGATRDPALRRVLLFDYVHERILPHLERRNVLPVHYDRWFGGEATLLREIGEFLEADVSATSLRIVRPTSTSVLSDDDVALIRRHCRTAEALGYDLSSWPSDGTGQRVMDRP